MTKQVPNTTQNTSLPKLSINSGTVGQPFDPVNAFREVASFIGGCIPKSALPGWGALFVVSDDLERDAALLNLKINHTFLFDYGINHSTYHERVVIVASGAPSVILCPNFATLEDARIFLEKNNLLTRAALLVHMVSTPFLFRYFTNGLSQLNNHLLIHSGGKFAQVLLDDLHAALDYIDNNVVCNANQVPVLWMDSGRHIPVKQAEKEIQKLLLNGLFLALGKDYVVYETNTSAGRADILVLPSGANHPNCYIELKVVRSFHSIKDPADVPRTVPALRNKR